MTPLAILVALLNSAGTLVPMIQKLIGDIQAGKGNTPLTDADWQALIALATETSDDIYRREGVTPPPPAAPPA